MLVNAYLHEEEIKKEFYKIWYDPKYQYYSGCGCFGEFSLAHNNDGNYNEHCFASISKTGELLGVVSYHVDRMIRSTRSFGAICFKDCSVEFAKDLIQAVDDIFDKFGMERMEFCVIKGNPAEKAYDRLVKRAGGRIVGTRRYNAMNLQGELCDDKIYEILGSDYFTAKLKRELKKEGLSKHDKKV